MAGLNLPIVGPSCTFEVGADSIRVEENEDGPGASAFHRAALSKQAWLLRGCGFAGLMLMGILAWVVFPGPSHAGSPSGLVHASFLPPVRRTKKAMLGEAEIVKMLGEEKGSEAATFGQRWTPADTPAQISSPTERTNFIPLASWFPTIPDLPGARHGGNRVSKRPFAVDPRTSAELEANEDSPPAQLNAPPPMSERSHFQGTWSLDESTGAWVFKLPAFDPSDQAQQAHPKEADIVLKSVNNRMQSGKSVVSGDAAVNGSTLGWLSVLFFSIGAAFLAGWTGASSLWQKRCRRRRGARSGNHPTASPAISMYLRSGGTGSSPEVEHDLRFLDFTTEEAAEADSDLSLLDFTTEEEQHWRGRMSDMIERMEERDQAAESAETFPSRRMSAMIERMEERDQAAESTETFPSTRMSDMIERMEERDQAAEPMETFPNATHIGINGQMSGQFVQLSRPHTQEDTAVGLRLVHASYEANHLAYLTSRVVTLIEHMPADAARLHARAASAVASASVLFHADLAFAQTSADNMYAATSDGLPPDSLVVGFAAFLVVCTGLLQLSLGDIQAEEANLPSSVSLINKNRQRSQSFIKSGGVDKKNKE